MLVKAIVVLRKDREPEFFHPAETRPEFIQNLLIAFSNNEYLRSLINKLFTEENRLFNQDLNLTGLDIYSSLFLSGINYAGTLFLVFSEKETMPKSMQEDYLRITTEQTNLLREAYQKLSQDKSPGKDKTISLILEEIAKVNNELINTQRELAKKEAELNRLYELEKELSNTDTLTGLLNRRGFMRLASWELEKAKRMGRPLSIALGDIDRFKNINDQFGHNLGDEVLKAVAQIIKTSLRQVDLVARWGGEEFLILLLETPPEKALLVINRVRMNIQKAKIPSLPDGYPLTISFGLSTWSEDKSLESMIEEADKFLYKAKSSGRNMVVSQ
ncbi:MAG: diguanylate cyclase [Candidatus Aminicenantes bacterium]|nr:diguanylate cyclase [Candidatus Aminicenantes bacterium]